jgi:hypothetical protein
MRYAYFIFILFLLASLHTNAQANKDYKQVKADNIKKIIVYDVRGIDTIGRTEREYDKKGHIVKYTDFSNWEGLQVPIMQKKYVTNCNGGCIIYEETRSFVKDGEHSFRYSSGVNIIEHRYTGTSNRRELSAFQFFEQSKEIERKKGKTTKEEMYGYLRYLYPEFKNDVFKDSSDIFGQYKSVTNFSDIILNNTTIIGEYRVYFQPLQGDSIPIEIMISTRNDSLEGAAVSCLFSAGKRTFTIRNYEFVTNKIPLNGLSFNFVDSSFHNSLNKLFNISQRTNLSHDSSRIITYTSGKFKLVTKYYITPEFDKYPEEDIFYDSTVTKYKRNHSSYTMKVFNNGKQIKTHIEYLKIRSEDYYVWDTYLELKRSHSKEYKLEYW